MLIAQIPQKDKQYYKKLTLHHVHLAIGGKQSHNLSCDRHWLNE